MDDWLAEFGLYGDWRAALGYYNAYKASNYVTLPFAGGLAQQPHWIAKNFTTFSLIEQWMEAFDDTPSDGSLGDWTETDI